MKGTQTLPDWCASHVRALNFLTGVLEIVVPDNLRSAITRPHRFEPDAHPTYTDLAEHYGFAIVPARVHRPRDKAKVRRQAVRVDLGCDVASEPSSQL